MNWFILGAVGMAAAMAEVVDVRWRFWGLAIKFDTGVLSDGCRSCGCCTCCGGACGGWYCCGVTSACCIGVALALVTGTLVVALA